MDADKQGSLLYAMMQKHGEEQPKKIGLIVDGTRYSYGQLAEAVQAARPAVKAAAIANGAVLIYRTSTYEQVIVWLAALGEGYRPVICHPDSDEAVRSAIATVAGKAVPLGDFGVLSSGTTGVPKILWRREASWYDFFPVQNEVFRLTSDTILFLHGSMSFTGNLNALLSVWYEGGTVVTASPLRPVTWARAMKKEDVTHLYVLPTKLRLLLEAWKEPLPALAMIFTGSQMLDTKLMYHMKQRFSQADFILYYGASELNYVTYCTGEEWLAEPNTVGRPFQGVEVSVDDHHMIYVTSPYTVEGVICPYSVGDKGYFSTSGRLMFEGRGGAVINRGGYKLLVPHMESVLQAIEGVAEAVVIGVPDRLRGEEPVAFIVPEKTAVPALLRKRIQAVVSPQERPHKIRFIEELPLTAGSKINRRALRALLEEK